MEAARTRGLQYAAEPTTPESFRSGVRAMRDGIALAELNEAIRYEAAVNDPAGIRGGGGRMSAAFAPIGRSTQRATVGSAVARAGALSGSTGATGPGGLGAAGAGGAGALAALADSAGAGPVAAAQAQNVWDAAARGSDVAAGGWYGWNVNGQNCGAGTDCADMMVKAFTTTVDWQIPPSFNCTSNVGLTAPFCLAQLIFEQARLIAEVRRWAQTMQGWIAIEEYREEVGSQIASSSAPYESWTSFGGSMTNVSRSAYFTSIEAAAMGVLPNPVCIVPPSGNPLPLHGVEGQDTVVYASTNDLNSPAIWDDSGGRRESHTQQGDGVWPPTDAMREIPLPDGTTKEAMPGLFEAGENLEEWRRIFYGDPNPEGNAYDPEMYGRFGAPTTQPMGAGDQRAIRDMPNVPPTLLGMDHLSGMGEPLTVVFRELSCPALDEPGSYGTIRPVVCQDGTVRSGFYLSDHQTSCAGGSEDCEFRIFSEPVLATGGRGFDARLNTGGRTADERAYSDLFGPNFRHICEVDSSGSITAIGDGRVAADDAVTMTSYQSYVYHWQNGPPGEPGEWVLGSGVGDGIGHGHPLDEGYYPRAGAYEDQNGNTVWFEPFSSYDNYADVQTAGDFGRNDEIVQRGTETDPGALFVEHEEESRIVYDEFIATPYEITERNADFQLWRGGRTGRYNTEYAHLIYGWPNLDLQDTDDIARWLLALATRRLTTQQRLFGRAPGSADAEQVWVRNDGPMGFFGATRVAVGAGDDADRETGKGGCLLQVNPEVPGFYQPTYGNVVPFRQVLDSIQQAWCVMQTGIQPENTCISIP